MSNEDSNYAQAAAMEDEDTEVGDTAVTADTAEDEATVADAATATAEVAATAAMAADTVSSGNREHMTLVA